MSYRRVKRICVVCWGPITSMRFGHFVRTLSLVYLLSRISKAKTIVIEFSEDLKSEEAYRAKVHSIYNARIIAYKVPGNESKYRGMVKWLRFSLYQVVNFFKMLRVLESCDAFIVAAAPFLVTTFLIKMLLRKIIVADPQMLLYIRELRRGVDKKVYLLLEKMYFRLSNIVIAISNEDRDRIEKIYKYNGRIVVIPHVMLNKESVTCKEIEKSFIGIGFIGNLRAIHNLEAALILIATISFLRRLTGKDIRLFLIGETIEAMEEKVKEYPFVTLTGFLSDDDLKDFICRNVDILASPTFTMSGTSTKMLLYLKFKNKIIIASKEALEGIQVPRESKVIVVSNVRDFVKHLLNVIIELSKKSAWNQR